MLILATGLVLVQQEVALFKRPDERCRQRTRCHVTVEQTIWRHAE